MYVFFYIIAAVSEELETTNETVDDPVSKYRALLQGIMEQEEKKKSRDVEMEVSWGVGLKDKTEEVVQKKLKERKDDLTPFEQYLKRRKEKKKQKKEERIKSIQQVKLSYVKDVSHLYSCLKNQLLVHLVLYSSTRIPNNFEVAVHFGY